MNCWHMEMKDYLFLLVCHSLVFPKYLPQSKNACSATCARILPSVSALFKVKLFLLNFLYHLKTVVCCGQPLFNASIISFCPYLPTPPRCISPQFTLSLWINNWSATAQSYLHKLHWSVCISAFLKKFYMSKNINVFALLLLPFFVPSLSKVKPLIWFAR